jgi:hypothetical protein
MLEQSLDVYTGLHKVISLAYCYIKVNLHTRLFHSSVF